MKIVITSLYNVLFTSLCLNMYSQITYPETKTVKQTDDYHGTKIEDPYRWLEDDNSLETKVWVEKQNKTTTQYLSQIQFRNKLKDRLTALWNFEKMSTPFKKGKLFFHVDLIK